MIRDWEKILASEGMPAELPRTPGQSLEKLRARTLQLQENLDEEIVQENQFSSSMPMQNGLPPCQRVKHNKRR
ncbi:hypothetical protein KKC08_03430 [Patescibacteria group bacterium]|nr:hypothetical protein [Patescibacteria group bacterium]MCG2701983.1 hypothetical protein [Candidatus Parcubacteria bacterium]MBU4265328.1 hypothetical protein [Patescibacteria group bacterium]MBU4389902.1 hypothetical protein [Patescibacteria group bacterium]MBU4397191.1 hypothetical protein [Patescibacteria group bacterium]